MVTTLKKKHKKRLESLVLDVEVQPEIIKVDSKKGLNEKVKEYLCDSMALVTIGNPIWAAYETLAVGMKPEISYNSKINGSLACIAGLGYCYSKFRDCFKGLVGIDNTKSRLKNNIADAASGFIYSSFVSPLIYFMSGETDIKKITLATFSQALASIPMGIVNGKTIDTARDLIDINKSPKILSQGFYDSSRYIKKSIAFSLAAVSAIGTYAYYKTIGM